MHKLAQNIKKKKNQTVSFYAYVSRPLEDNAGNKITQEFLMAEELNMHVSSVFTREDVHYQYQKQSSMDQNHAFTRKNNIIYHGQVTHRM